MALHSVAPERVYPESQTGVQAVFKAKVAVQSPASPLAGAAEASQDAYKIKFSSQKVRKNWLEFFLPKLSVSNKLFF